MKSGKQQINPGQQAEIALQASELTCERFLSENNSRARLQVEDRLEVKQTILLKTMLYNINIYDIERELYEISLVGIEE